MWEKCRGLELSMSRLDFLILALQSSNGFDLIPLFLQVLFSLILTVYEGCVPLMRLGSLCSTEIFWKVENNVSVLFIALNLQTVFCLKPMFLKGPSFFVILFVWGFEFAPACGSPASVSDHVMTSQNHKKVKHVRI